MNFFFFFPIIVCWNPFRLLSHQKCDLDDFYIINDITFPHHRNRKACYENNFKIFSGMALLSGWEDENENDTILTPRSIVREKEKIKISFININLTSIIIYHFASPMSCSLCQSRGRNPWCKINISFNASSCLYASPDLLVSVEKLTRTFVFFEGRWWKKFELIQTMWRQQQQLCHLWKFRFEDKGYGERINKMKVMTLKRKLWTKFSQFSSKLDVVFVVKLLLFLKKTLILSV